MVLFILVLVYVHLYIIWLYETECNIEERSLNSTRQFWKEAVNIMKYVVSWPIIPEIYIWKHVCLPSSHEHWQPPPSSFRCQSLYLPIYTPSSKSLATLKTVLRHVLLGRPFQRVRVRVWVRVWANISYNLTIIPPYCFIHHFNYEKYE